MQHNVQFLSIDRLHETALVGMIENCRMVAVERIINNIKKLLRWNEEAGGRRLVSMALPLIVSTGSWSIQHFVDRMFLAWYSPEALAASMPAGITNFTIMSFFIGIASFVSTFVAQYVGANQPKMVGPILWQGLYLSIIGGVVLFVCAFFSEEIFAHAGHEQPIQKLEVVYFRILCYGAFPAIGSSALASFFIGRGENALVMWNNLATTAINLFLDYLLIFGNWGFPRLGIEGAAWATVCAGVFNFALYAVCIYTKKNNLQYHTIRGWAIKPLLFVRLLRFGFPNGVQFFIDVAGYTIFLLLVGKLGTVALAATNIAFNINTLAFMPMIGFGIAVSTMVGQFIGAGRPNEAERVSKVGFLLTFAYMLGISFFYVVTPYVFIQPFSSNSQTVDFTQIYELTKVLLRFVAVYSLFDTASIIFASAIKGAGDTRFVMLVIASLSTSVLVIPTYLALNVFGFGIIACWTIATTYISLLGLVFYFRFRSGKWKSMKVIEEFPSVIALRPEVPSIE
ncbi:MAG: MATE family efflux transporter [Spirochaetes bacterium]|nr:MATE family efflux transporter [Spirochaetota bacterium]